MRFRVDVNTLDGKLSFEKAAPRDALEVARGAKANLGVTITDTQESTTYSLEDFEARVLTAGKA